jgi:DNA (cytosine-5)-methyltransferase 1
MISKGKILNLCCGIGGNRKLWEGYQITAVESDPKIAKVYQILYPNDTVVVGDAYQYLLDHFMEFGKVWGSFPCQSHSKMMKFTRHNVIKYPDLRFYGVIIFLTHFFKGKWVIENVNPYYTPLIPPTVKIGRHLFWSNCEISPEFVQDNAKNFINLGSVKDSAYLKDWLGIHYEGNLYYKDNHDPNQVLRNAVHPDLGLYILNQMKD